MTDIVDQSSCAISATTMLTAQNPQQNPKQQRAQNSEHCETNPTKVPDVVNQGSCGSCYAISATTMLTARKRILEDDPSSEAFSTQIPLYCGECAAAGPPPQPSFL